MDLVIVMPTRNEISFQGLLGSNQDKDTSVT